MSVEVRATSVVDEVGVKREPAFFVWFELAKHYRIRKEQVLSCQIVHDKHFMPAGVVAKHELSDFEADCLSTGELAKKYPAPEIVVDAQG